MLSVPIFPFQPQVIVLTRLKKVSLILTQRQVYRALMSRISCLQHCKLTGMIGKQWPLQVYDTMPVVAQFMLETDHGLSKSGQFVLLYWQYNIACSSG